MRVATTKDGLKFKRSGSSCHSNQRYFSAGKNVVFLHSYYVANQVAVKLPAAEIGALAHVLIGCVSVRPLTFGPSRLD